jgi:hypothetical protein
MRVGPLLAHLDELEAAYAQALREAAARFQEEPDVFHQCLTFATAADAARQKLAPLRQRYSGKPEWEVVPVASGKVLLEELRALYLMAQQVAVSWVMAQQAAKAARDADLKEAAGERHTEADIEAKWFLTRIKVGAPQALVVA